MSIAIAGTLYDPFGNAARFADIKLITLEGSTTVVESSNAVYRTDELGAYSFSVEFGRFAVLMRYNGNNGAYEKIQSITVNSDTVATTLEELLAYTEPLTPAEILIVQQLVAEATTAKDDAEAAAIAAGLSASESAASAAAALVSENAAANSVALLAPVPLNGGVWASGQIFTAYNQYMIFGGEAYSPLPATTLPYTVGAAPDLGFVYQVKLNDASLLANFGGTTAQYTDLTFDTLNAALASDLISDGDVISVHERDSGGGGGGDWRVVLSSSVTPNSYDIVQCIALPSLAIVIVSDSEISPRQIGVVADGVADDTAALQNLFNKYKNIAGRSDDIYKTTALITIPDTLESVNYNFNGATLKSDGGFVALNQAETIGASATILTDIERGQNKITVGTLDVGSFESGDLIQIRSNKLWYFDNRGIATKGETHVVDRVDGTSIYTQSPIFETYESATEAITVVAFNKTKMMLKGLNYENAQGTDGGIQLRGLVDSVIDVSCNGARGIGILLKNSYNSHVANSSIKNANQSGLGYGVQITQSSYCTTYNSMFWNCRRGVDISGREAVSYYCGVLHNTNTGVDLDSSGAPLFAQSSGFGSHGSSAFSLFADNKIYNVSSAFVARGFKETVRDNSLFGTMTNAVASTDGADLTVINNTYESGQSQSNPVAGDARLLAFLNVTHRDNRGATTVIGNKANRIVSNLVLLVMDAGADTANVRGYDIIDNTYGVYSNSAGGSFTEIESFSGAITMKSCRMKGNSGSSLFGGSINKYDPNISIDLGLLDSCVVENFPLTLAASVGAPSSIVQSVRCNILEERIDVYGHLEFVSAGEVTQFDGFPHPNLGPKQSFAHAAYGVGDVVLSYTGNTGNLGKYYMAPTAAAPTGALSAGTYEIAVNFSFNRKTAQNFN